MIALKSTLKYFCQAIDKTTINQLIKVKRKKKKKIFKTPALGKKHQRRDICHNFFFMDPKKQNSANRHVARAAVLWTKYMRIPVFIPGGLHSLQRFSRLLMRGGRVRDLPGVFYKVIRGKLDCSRVRDRERKRSKYGTEKYKTKARAKVLSTNMKIRRQAKMDHRGYF